MADPFEQLTRSHRRLEERLADLVEAASGERLDEALARDAADFLGRQARRHEDDEEQSLFPRLATVAGLATVIDQLRGEHAKHVALHESLERALSDATNLDELRRVARAIEDAYREHIDVEEAVLFPAARKALSADDLSRIMEEMQARRGRTPEGGGRRHDRR